jgi:hypothetical protein
MEKLQAGKVARLKRKLTRAIPEPVLLQNETGLDIVFEEEESLDGSRPSLTIRIKQVLGVGSERSW